MTLMKSLVITLATASLGYADLVSIFDGKTLEGWKGDSKYWRVEDGAITGESTAANPCKKTTYLVYEGKEVSDFELTVSYRFLSKQGNSGIQYRSAVKPNSFQVKGYQADMETGANYSGILYDQDGRGIVAQRGQVVHISKDGKKIIKPLNSGAAAQKSIKQGDWNEYKIVADGKTLSHFINGHKTVEVIDNDSKHRDAKGRIALQLHQGPAMKVQFKNIQFLELDHKVAGSLAEDDVALKNMKTLPGFKVEEVYSVEKSQGSWVSMTFDDKGALYVSSQYGKLYKLTFQDGKVTNVEPLKSPGKAQGLCWAYGSLYMSVASNQNGGIYRLTDTNNSGEFDKQEHLIALNTGNEHGIHGVIKSKQGGLYFVAGNYTPLPKGARSINNNNWLEDKLLKHLLDPRGHANNIKAPAGYVVHINPDGSDPKVIATGMRNTYDIALSPSGSLFGYDADMEWDAGTPWYRPTRLNHITVGAEFGWRTGTSKWPNYFADSLPPVIEFGPGSPAGVVFGTDAKFPKRYQDAVYLLDWTFGRIYAVHLSPEGSSYKADKEVLVSSKALPVTDAAIGSDGAMYFTTGGRRLGSKLYRVAYTREVIADEDPAPSAPLANVLDELLGNPKPSFVWSKLDSEDRRIRYTARVALEVMRAEKWADAYKKETNPVKLIEATIALARLGGSSDLQIKKLSQIDFRTLTEDQKLAYLRALSLCVIRDSAALENPVLDKMKRKLETQFPASSFNLNVELAQMLTKLQSKSSTLQIINLIETSVNEVQDIDPNLLLGNRKYGKDLERMLANQPNAKALRFALVLMDAKEGWNQASVKRYHTWLNQAELRDGGASYKGFIKNIRKEALKGLPEEMQKLVQELPKPVKAAKPMALAKGPGRAWTFDEAKHEIKDVSSASFENGRRMFEASLCSRCHIHGSEGGVSGPNLTNLASRFSAEDILKAILDPSEVVSEQYHFHNVTMKDGSTMLGKVLSKNDKEVVIALSAFDLTQTMTLNASDVKSIKASETSPMPPAMINNLNPSELRDLMKFLTTAK